MPAFDLRDWHRIGSYLDEALNLEPNVRARWLETLATTQADLVQTLHALLAERESLRSDGFLEHSLLNSTALAALREAPKAGMQVGAYTIDRPLGRGGMGEVWLASRSDGRFEAQCAIKFLCALATQPKLKERFRQEAALLARLGHPNIARLLDAGATADGSQFLVLEYVDGLHIDEYCEHNELPVRARVRLFLDAVAAVAHAHSHLIVHRDLKPSNVLVTRDGTVKLLDFGIAKLVSAEQALSNGTATHVEEIAITPEYAAPEQLLGDMTSTATDVFQLGMVLYVLLAGRHPLQLSGSRAERIKAALNGKLPRASEFAAKTLRKELRGDLDAILGRALHASPAQRYPTAAALRDDLLRYLNSEPVSARRGTRLYDMAKFIARHRVATVASLIAIVSLCGTLIFALAQARLAAVERDHALALASRNQAVTLFLGMLITEAAESDKPVTVTEMLARSEKLALADTNDSPENRAAVLQMIAEHFATFDDEATAERLFRNGLSLLAHSEDHTLRSALECEHASTISHLGQIDAAERTLQRVLRQEQSDPQIAANCLYFLSDIATTRNQAELALSYAKQALERLRQAPRIVAIEEPLFLDAVGYGYYMQGRIHEANQYYQEAVQKYSKLGRAANANAIAVRNDWAVVLNGAGVPKRALEIFDGTLRLMAEHYQGEAPPPSVVGNRARVLEAIGRFEEARAAYELELQIAEQRANIESQALALTGLAITSQDLHDRSAAAQYLQHFTNVSTPALPPEMLPWQWYAIAQARLEMADGKFTAARAHFAQALGSASNAAVMSARLGKSEAELRAGDSAAALEDARLAMQTATKMQGDLPYSNFTGLSWRALGQAQQELSHDAEAQHAFENAALHLSNTVDANHPALVDVRNRLPPNRQ